MLTSGTSTCSVTAQHLAEVGRERIEVDEMGVGHPVPAGPHPLHPGGDGAVGGAPADDQHLGAVLVVDLGRRDVVGDAGDLGRPQAGHPLVVGAVVGDVARAVGLLQTADPVLQTGHAGRRPRSGQRLLVPDVGPEDLGAVGIGVVGCGGEAGIDVGQVVEVGQPPRLGAVGQVAVGQQDHRCAVLDRQSDRLERRFEAVGGCLGRHDGQRRLAVTAVHGVEQVGLLGLGREPGGGAAALDVDDQQRAARG